MYLSWLSLLPPIIVIGAMFVTHQLNISLVIGIISAALIATQGHMFPAFALCMEKCVEHFSDIDIIFLYGFMIAISSLVVLLTVTGSAIGCVRIISKKIRTIRDGELAAIVLSSLLSIDDYLSILTVGMVMTPVADTLAIARTKLAYIIHALAGPLVIIVPISTWAAAVLAQLNRAGINQGATSKIFADSFYVYLKTIPFVFYSFFTVGAVWLIVMTRMGFGSIGHAERTITPVGSFDNAPEENNNIRHSLIEIFLPVALLIISVFFGILYAGDYYLFGGINSFVNAFKESDKTFLILLLASLAAFLCSAMISLYKKFIIIRDVPRVISEGFILMKSAVIMIVLASILGSFLRVELQTGSYLALVLIGKTPLFLLPVLLFCVSLSITLMTGSAWGTFSMLIPISIQMLIELLGLKSPVMLDQIPMMLPVLGAVLSGAACGNHLSPFAETTIMTAASTGIEPVEHAKTQFVYAVPVIMGTIVSFVLAGLMIDHGLLYCFLVSAGGGGAVSLGFYILFCCSKK